MQYSDLSVGSLAEYNCSEGFLLMGVTTRVCQMNGTWSEDVPVCLGGEMHVLIVSIVALKYNIFL